MRIHASLLLPSLLFISLAVNFLEVKSSSVGQQQSFAVHVGVEQGSDKPKSGGRRA